MPYILSVGTETPPFKVAQDQTKAFARSLFSEKFDSIERLLSVFHNGQIDSRYFSAPLDWFKVDHSLKEKNDRYIDMAVELSEKVVKKALANSNFLNREVPCEDIDAIFFISTTGLATPSIEARLMNRLPFNPKTKRIPIWGLGCAGGVAGLARAFDYCQAYPESSVLVICVELCSLTFQHNDHSKSNLIGTSLFADGGAAVVVSGDASRHLKFSKKVIPKFLDSRTTLMPHSENVMGWDIRDTGLFVVFDKSIPVIVEKWFKGVAEEFLEEQRIRLADCDHFIAHPGGRKVLEAYENAFGLSKKQTAESLNILKQYGNMSSPTVLFVLEQSMEKAKKQGERGVAASLGPGFSSELLSIKWEVVS